MGSPDARALRASGFGLRFRFLLAGTLLVLMTVASGIWSALAFRRLSNIVGDTLNLTEETATATASLASALEREDDAILLSLHGADQARSDLAGARAHVDRSFARLRGLARGPEERALIADLARQIDAYRAAAGVQIARSGDAGVLESYQSQVNPLLRRCVGIAGFIRERHFRLTRKVALQARDEARQSTRIVTAISCGALALSVFVSLLLARSIIGPVRELTRGVEAIREGDFARRLEPGRADELARLADGFNRMADHLAEFHRTNVGAVIRAKQTLETTLAALPDAVLVIEPDGRVRAANDLAQRVFRSLRAGSERYDELSLPAGTTTAIHSALSGARLDLAGGAGAGPMRVVLDGQERRLLPRVVPVPAFSGDRTAAVLVLSDVTEFVRLDEMRLELVAVASHELRTPLTTMRMTLLMLKESASAFGARERELLATGLLGIEQLGAIVDKFLDLTLIESGQLRLALEPVELAGLLRRVLVELSPRIDEAGVALVTALDDLPAPVWGDPARLRAVFANVLDNALKYTPRGGRIVVECSPLPAESRDAPGSRVTIADTGPGVPPELRERIFEKFFRAEVQRPSGVKGSGIGLYLCRQIIEAHGGEIRCDEPDEAGIGMVISIALRAVVPQRTQDEAGRALGASRRLSRQV